MKSKLATHRHVSERGSVSYWDHRHDSRDGPGHDVSGPGGVVVKFADHNEAAAFAMRVAGMMARDLERERFEVKP